MTAFLNRAIKVNIFLALTENYRCLHFKENVIVMFLNSSVWAEPKLGSARFWLQFLGKKAQLAMPSKKLGSAHHILQKSSVQLGLLYDLKNRVTLKNKK